MSDLTRIPPIPESWDPNRDTHDDYRRAVEDAILNHPRSLQTAIGPSEIGAPCTRKLAYKLLGTPKRALPPNWRATAGTGIHMWMEDAFDRANLTWAAHNGNQGVERYLIEERVNVGSHLNGEPITGSCDLYDRLTQTVIDHKTCTKTRLATFKASGPPDVYRVQANLYGLGWVRAGFPVRHVAISFLPRDGELRDAYWWQDTFNPVIAAEALKRLHGIETAIQALGNQAPAALPTADDYCGNCPFYKANSTDLSQGCPGHPGAVQEQQPALSLSA